MRAVCVWWVWFGSWSNRFMMTLPALFIHHVWLNRPRLNYDAHTHNTHNTLHQFPHTPQVDIVEEEMVEGKIVRRKKEKKARHVIACFYLVACCLSLCVSSSLVVCARDAARSVYLSVFGSVVLACLLPLSLCLCVCVFFLFFKK